MEKLGKINDLISYHAIRVLHWLPGSNNWAQSVTGSGSTQRNDKFILVDSGTTANSTALARSQGPGNACFTSERSINSSSNNPDYSKTLVWGFVMAGFGTETSTGLKRYSFGKKNDGIGNLTRAGWQITIEGSGGSATLKLGVHDGTTFTEGSPVAISPSGALGGFDVKPVIVVLKNGVMFFYYGSDAVNFKTPTAALNGAPTTGVGTISGPEFQVEVSNGTNAASHRADLIGLRTLIVD